MYFTIMVVVLATINEIDTMAATLQHLYLVDIIFIIDVKILEAIICVMSIMSVILAAT